MTDHKPCDPADPCSTAYDLASERNTLDGLLSETKDRLIRRKSGRGSRPGGSPRAAVKTLSGLAL